MFKQFHCLWGFYSLSNLIETDIMTLKYKVVKQAEPGVKGGGEYQYYIRAVERGKVDVEELARNIASRCTLTHMDVQMVLLALAEVIPKMLLDNNSVELGKLGIFSLSLKSDPSPSEEEATWRKIKGVKVNFRVGKEIQEKVKSTSFKKL